MSSLDEKKCDKHYLFFFKREYQKRNEAKKQLEDLVRNEGYGFNDQAQLKEPTNDSNNGLLFQCCCNFCLSF
jgi:hypothetical protein